MILSRSRGEVRELLSSLLLFNENLIFAMIYPNLEKREWKRDALNIKFAFPRVGGKNIVEM